MDFDDTQEFMPEGDNQGSGNVNEINEAVAAVPQPAAKKKKRSIWRIFFRLIFTVSIIVNAIMFIVLIVMAIAIGSGHKDAFMEETIEKGKSKNKIVIIRLEGIIENDLSEELKKQFETAEEDRNVKAVILRTISPGGSVSASDRIHHEIISFRRRTGIPVVAFMQGVAASGGYYTSVACDKIIAEPTVITGSIGVMLSHMVFKGLLEDKLGILPVVLKSGPKKDWPSMFSETTEEEKEYLMDKLVTPAYDRFVSLVVQGRPMLDKLEVIAIADGSIYGAEEALEKQLIDRIGYLEDALQVARKLAGIEDGHVVEYTRPFSLSDLLSSQTQSLFKLDRNTLHELSAPQLMYLWDAGR